MPQYNEGKTVKLIATDCKAISQLASCAWCELFISGLCETIGMVRLAGPWSEKLTHPKNPSLSGVSAVMIIQESEIGIHTWLEASAARIMIDSCRDFDLDVAIEYVKDWLRTESVEVHCCRRSWFEWLKGKIRWFTGGH